MPKLRLTLAVRIIMCGKVSKLTLSAFEKKILRSLDKRERERSDENKNSKSVT